MNEILHYLNRMIPAVLLGLAVYLLSRPIRLRRLSARGEGTSGPHEVCLVLFLMLTAGLLWLTVLPEIIWTDGRLIFQEEGFGNINMKPFIIFWQSRVLAQQGVRSYFLINFWGNIAMFLPIGFFPTMLWRKARGWNVIPGGALLSFGIELCQIPIHRGTDVDDLWLNTLGVLLGWLIARFVGAAWPKAKAACYVRSVDHGS